MTITGIVLTSIVMALTLGSSWLLLGLASNYVCQLPRVPPEEVGACFDRYQAWLLTLLGVQLVAIVGAIVLWVRSRRAIWGSLVGLVGTVGAAAVFTVAFRVPL